MDWSEQTEQLMKTWTDAQKQLWSGWMNWAQNAPGMSPAMFDPTQLFRAGVDTWSGAKETAPHRLAGNIFGTPDMMMLAMNLIMKAWQVAAPKIEGGKDWQPDIKKLLTDWRDEATNLPKRAAAMSNEFSQLTKSMFERWSPLTAPWLAMLGRAASEGHPGEAFMGGTAGLGQIAGFGEAFQLMRGMGEFGLSELPRATVAREKMGKFLRVLDTISDLEAAQRAYHKKLSDGIATSVERTIDHLAKLAEKGESISSARELMRTFFSIADKTLLETFNTKEFLEIQDKLTLALMKHKIAQREALEIVYNSMEIPTRSEIDEAYRDIHDLKREVRALKKALKEATSGKASSTRGGKKAAKEVEPAEPAAS